MISYKQGNILDAEADVLVNTVNSVGVMGKGIALQFKKNFPENFKEYRKAVEQGIVKPGKVFMVRVNTLGKVKYIANFATKNHWRYPSKIQWIQSGLIDLKEQLINLDIDSVAIPPLGCGHGGLNWEEVKKLISETLKGMPINVYTYEPTEYIKEILKKEFNPKGAKLTHARAMLLHMLFKYRALGEDVTEFAAEKLSYFLQKLGEKQMKLDFTKGYYGPYSGKVRHVLYAVNGYYLKGFEQKQPEPFEPLELVVEKKPELLEYLEKNLSQEQKNRLHKLEKLIEGFETPYGLELLASVDFIISRGTLPEPSLIKDELDTWSDRKRNLFELDHVEMAIRKLTNSVDPIK